MAGVAAGLALVAWPTPVRAILYVDGFQGPFAPANWMQQPNGGSINTGGAPNSIGLTSANNNSGARNTNFLFTFSTTGILSFNWSYITSDTDGPVWDPFGYSINGAFTQLTNNAGPNIWHGFLHGEQW
ncbi:hypothetical protein [Cyanobium sp. Morenito 9A2]|uniref:hypothetical protein n=1 Tax=Cyanobium sp. Morenito 9A2 TaxID=2823718 RepID=UPI0020CFA0CC|nr:hypothetical protein [Cyanobium sp. Morenito 9A2]MCP9848726.1 hypothetical protein [Cyanobium sp. Morenito 9A2]